MENNFEKIMYLLELVKNELQDGLTCEETQQFASELEWFFENYINCEEA